MLIEAIIDLYRFQIGRILSIILTDRNITGFSNFFLQPSNNLDFVITQSVASGVTGVDKDYFEVNSNGEVSVKYPLWLDPSDAQQYTVSV